MNPEISIVNSVRAQLGEGPFWYDGALYWVDILEKKIYRHFLQGDRVEEMQLDYYVSAIAPRKKASRFYLDSMVLSLGLSILKLTNPVIVLMMESVTMLGDFGQGQWL